VTHAQDAPNRTSTFRRPGTRKTPKPPDKLVLQKPTAISGKKNTWFDRFYVVGSLLAGDRKLFSK